MDVKEFEKFYPQKKTGYIRGSHLQVYVCDPLIQWLRFLYRNKKKTSSTNQQSRFDRYEVTSYTICLKSGNLA